MAAPDLSGSWNYPNSISVGAGHIAELPDTCAQEGMERPLLVTDPGLAQLPALQAALESCRQAELDCDVFSGIQGNPTGANVLQGLQAYRKGGHDGVIAFGGGSALDAGKAVALMAGQDRPLWDFEDVGDNASRVKEEGVAPLIAVPTTAGTGSEVGRAAVITDQEARVKRVIFHPLMLPRRVILDPELTVGLPANLTAATGMDALSHNLEALCAPSYHPMADGIAIEGIRLVKVFLPRAVGSPGDLEARMQMQVASAMGATAFQKGLGAMHALAHSLGALYDAHHGLLNAILMPYVLVANREAIEPRLNQVAAYLQLEEGGFEGFVGWVLQLRREIGIPDNLSQIGIDARDSQLVAEMATRDSCAGGNPIAFSSSQYEQIFLLALGH